MEEPIGHFLESVTKQQFLEGALEREMLGYPVSTVEDIMSDRQLAARDFWDDITDSATGRSLKAPGGFAIINGQRLGGRKTNEERR